MISASSELGHKKNHLFLFTPLCFHHCQEKSTPQFTDGPEQLTISATPSLV